MGWFDRFKKAFDTGGVGVRVATAKTFRWSDDALPVDITFTNSSKEPRTISSVRLQLVEHDRENPATTRKVRGRYEGMNLVIDREFTVAAGGEHAVHVDMPLSLQGAADEMGVDDPPEWMERLSDAVNLVTELNRDQEWYLLRVMPEVEGFTAKKIGTRRIRNLRAGEWGGGIFKMTIGGDG